MAKDSNYAKVGTRARTDPAFKAKLLSEPAAALAAMGVVMPAGVTVKVVENTPALVHLVLPSVPAPGELSERDLNAVVGGDGSHPLADQYILW